MHHLTLSALFVYPVKSARGISLDEAKVDDRGLEHDRRFMIVDRAGRFTSQREHPSLARLATEIRGDSLLLHAPHLGTLELPLRPAKGPTRTVQVWRSTCDAIAVGDDAAAFLSRYLGAPVELVYMPDSTLRPVNPAIAKTGEVVSFADGYPFLLLGQSSLDELNRRLAHPLPIDRFRPNLVVQGAAPHDEDEWPSFAIGPVVFHAAKPCDRCVITTIDQSTLARSEEPLRTLATYRSHPSGVIFGQYLLHRGHGTLRRGDRLHPAE
jgi:uncharacterized protein YcbX